MPIAATAATMIMSICISAPKPAFCCARSPMYLMRSITTERPASTALVGARVKSPIEPPPLACRPSFANPLMTVRVSECQLVTSQAKNPIRSIFLTSAAMMFCVSSIAQRIAEIVMLMTTNVARTPWTGPAIAPKPLPTWPVNALMNWSRAAGSAVAIDELGALPA